MREMIREKGRKRESGMRKWKSGKVDGRIDKRMEERECYKRENENKRKLMRKNGRKRECDERYELKKLKRNKFDEKEQKKESDES